MGTVKKDISAVKSGKATGSSGIVLEMIRAAGDTSAIMIPTDWGQSFSVCPYTANGDALMTKATIEASSWPNRLWRSKGGLSMTS